MLGRLHLRSKKMMQLLLLTLWFLINVIIVDTIIIIVTNTISIAIDINVVLTSTTVITNDVTISLLLLLSILLLLVLMPLVFDFYYGCCWNYYKHFLHERLFFRNENKESNIGKTQLSDCLIAL